MTTDTAPAAARARQKIGSWRPALPSLSGCLGALVGFLLAVTPSLLPRPAFFLGLVCGIAAAIGYGIGTGLAAVAGRIGIPDPSPTWRRRLAAVLAALSVSLVAGGVILGIAWQNEIRQSLGIAQDWSGPLTVILAAGATFLALVGLGRFLRLLTRRAVHSLAVHLPRWMAIFAGFVLVVAVVLGITSNVIVGGVVYVADRVYAGNNAGSADGVAEPTSTVRSGGPQSLMSWDSLGREGRAFVSAGPDAAQIASTTGRPAIEPIRAYAGLDSAPTPQDRAELVVSELQRTGAFDRSVLVVAGVAGTGWLESQSIDGIEYIWGGDSAIAASQYSYLPSWISFLVDQDRARAEGRELFDAVWREWSQLPQDDRPKLIAYGLSLGSFSIQSAFGSQADLVERTDGAVLAGTPSFSEPWRSISDGRDAGSPQWQPIVAGGETVRFADDSDDLTALGPWPAPRIAYLQHADDPVVWWSFDLIAQRPDWLAEPRGPAVSHRMTWMPIITFLQVTVDQFFGVNQPNGYGHNYSLHMAQTWVDVAGAPQGWTTADTEAVQSHLTG